LTLDKFINSYLKLAYANPRPYMVKSEIKLLSCSKGFGNPSGHAAASSLISIVLFLDYFHGTPL
jgi:membrane-associated phospholipid phosphatase